MKRLTLLLLCLMPLETYAQRDGLRPDGVYWNKLDKLQKLSLVIGFASGYASGMQDAISTINPGKVPTAIFRDSPFNVNLGALVQGVDSCYADYRNVNVNVLVCINWTIRGISGESDAARNAYLIEQRAEANPNPK